MRFRLACVEKQPFWRGFTAGNPTLQWTGAEAVERRQAMDAAVLHTLVKPPRYEQFPEPIPGEGEVIVHVRAASLKSIDKQLANGSHYASPRELPIVCGSDGVGLLDDGTRVFFGGARRPYGAMSQRTVVPRAFCFPVPEGVDQETAAALPNPGVSAWLSLAFRARLAPGENVLILGATGVTGKLAVKIAKLLGAGRVVAAGRNQQVLGTLHELGADATIRLDQPAQELSDAFARESGNAGFQVVIDYVWGHPTEAFLAAITRKQFAVVTSETRLVQVGESAGPTISLPAAVLRSTALTILGTAGIPPHDVLVNALQQVMALAASGELHVDTEPIPLADVEAAWQRDPHGRRLVMIP
jgi:NADPH:quinone reductase-like Zn-dependent oxidoreductase